MRESRTDGHDEERFLKRWIAVIVRIGDRKAFDQSHAAVMILDHSVGVSRHPRASRSSSARASAESSARH
jgi:hypothetical protein